MVFPHNHMLFAWSGHFLKGGQEVIDDFAGSLRFTGPGVAASKTDEVLLAMATTMTNYVADARSGIPTGAWFDNFKWNEIDTAGHYVDRNNTLQTEGSPKAAGGVTARYPTQVACATTWTTDFGRGRASKGRTFWPTAFTVSPDSRLMLQAGDQASLANWSIDLIRALNLSATTAAPQVPTSAGGVGTGEPGALAACVMSNIGSGASAVINGARVGSRLDIQRRRGNRLAETYVNASFTTRA